MYTMAANGSSVCDEKKKIRKMSLSYLKNTFQKKSAVETASNESDDDLLNAENRKMTTELCTDRVTESSAHQCNPDNKSLNREVEYNDISKTKSNGFFRSIKKRLNIRDLKLCKSKQKVSMINGKILHNFAMKRSKKMNKNIFSLH